MKIYLTRHGEVPSNIKKIYNLKEEDLTEKGLEQADILRKKVEKLDYDAIYTSPYLRAVHTAELANAKDKKIIIDERLREREAGDLIGKPLDSTDRREYWKYDPSIEYPTSEDIKTFFERIRTFIESLKDTSYDAVLVVAHSGVSKAFSAYFDGIGDGEFLDRGIDNCEIKEYELD